MKQIIHAVHIHAAPPDVYRSLTTGEGLSQWWTRLEPNRRLEWLCVGGHANWLDNTFTFTQDERKGETLLLFSQDYARELSTEVYGIYNFNWGDDLNSLKMLCEKGAGVPFVPPA
jgi:hypothetical protein